MYRVELIHRQLQLGDLEHPRRNEVMSALDDGSLGCFWLQLDFDEKKPFLDEKKPFPRSSQNKKKTKKTLGFFFITLPQYRTLPSSR